MTHAALELQIVDQNAPVPSVDFFNRWVQAALDAAPADRHSVTIRIVDRDEMVQLNRDYAKKDAPTNVLSFPFEPIDQIESDFLGDIAICSEVVASEATEQGKQWEAHWAHMVIHGVFHLCGYDHIDAIQAEEMEALEASVMSGLGFPDPYQGD
jgi:probable rRNA maturation factor